MTTKRIAKLQVIDPGSNPDIDSDFNTEIRDKAVERITETEGKDKIANIITFGTLAAKSAFKTMCTIYQIPFSSANSIASLVPPPVEGVDCTLDDIFDPSSDRYSEASEFRAAVSGSEWTKIIEGAKNIESRIKSTGVHPCGIIWSSKPLSDIIPLQTRVKDGRVITQWTYPELEAIGLIKYDFLGLDTVDLLQYTVQYIEKNGKNPPNMIDLIHGEMDDRRTYDLFSRGDTIGVFQFGSALVQDYCKFMKPTEFNDLAATTALLRPGPMGMQSHVRYALRKNGQEEATILHPDFENSPLVEILGPTQQVIVFQEQILKIANQIAGMTLQEGDVLRSAMGKKKMAVMLTMRVKFFEGATKNGYSEEAIEELWSTIEYFAKYGFNRCLAARTKVSLSDGTGKITVEELYTRTQKGGKIEVDSLYENGEIKPHTVKEVVKTGLKPLYLVRTKSGRRIRITKEHRLLTTSGYKTIEDGGISVGQELIVDSEWTEESNKSNTKISQDKDVKSSKVNKNNLTMQDLAKEYLISRGVEFETHKVLRSATNGGMKACDFYANGLYFEMDGMCRGREYFVKEKYGNDLPFVYMTPLNYKDAIDEALMSHHVENGDAIVEIIEPKIFASGRVASEATFDIEMEDTGPSNFIADGIVSHNSHSVAYAMNAYSAAYLKANYPIEFMSALIAQNIGEKEKILTFLQEANRMKLKVGSADIGKSDVRVSPDYTGSSDFDIVYGLSGVQSVSPEMAKLIVDERENNGEFTSIQDVVNRCSALGVNNRKIYENLALAGGFDCFGITRRAAVENLNHMLSDAKNKKNLGSSLFDFFDDEEDDSQAFVDFSKIPEYPFVEKLQKEANVVGLYLTDHPLKNLGIGLSQAGCVSIKKIIANNSSVTVNLVGSISNIEKKPSRNGGKSIKITIDDGTGLMQANLQRKIVKGLDKKVAQERIRRFFVNGETKIAPEVLELAIDKDFDITDPIEKNSVYFMNITFRAGFGDASYGARINSIEPLELGYSGELPVRMRYEAKDLNSVSAGGKKIESFAKTVSEKFPGKCPIFAATYSKEDICLELDEEGYFKNLVSIMKSDSTKVAVATRSKEENKSLFSEKKAKTKETDAVPKRILPEVDNFMKSVKNFDEEYISKNVKYYDTGFTMNKSDSSLQLLMDKLSIDRVDFGLFNQSAKEKF